MDNRTTNFVRAGALDELKAKGQVVLRGPHRPILLVYAHGRVFAFDNRCPHMGFPLDRGSVEDGILTCHWHHARFDLASGCTFDLWADDVPTCPVEVRDLEVWVKPSFGYGDPAACLPRDGSERGFDLGNAPHSGAVSRRCSCWPARPDKRRHHAARQRLEGRACRTIPRRQ